MIEPSEPSPEASARAAFQAAAQALSLSDKERESILGALPDQIDRIGQLLAIYEGAGRLVGDPIAWLRSSNTGTPFDGQSPLRFILEDPSVNLQVTKTYLEGAYGGWA